MYHKFLAGDIRRTLINRRAEAQESIRFSFDGPSVDAKPILAIMDCITAFDSGLTSAEAFVVACKWVGFKPAVVKGA